MSTSGIEEKLREIRAGLTPKPFRSELVDALEHLIRIESVKQDQFRLSDVEWPKLDYFAHQLKKMIKNKAHLDVLCSRMSSVSGGGDGGAKIETTKSSTTTNKHHVNDLLDVNSSSSSSGQQRNYSSLINDGNYSDSDYFSLTSLLVRLAVKSIRLRSKSHEQQDRKLFDFVLVLISCLADLSLYEDLRGQLVNDINLRCLFHIFACETKCELDEKLKQKRQQQQQQQHQQANSTGNKIELDDLKKLWTKMCRFAANICQDKHLHKLKHLISNDFMPSLNKFMDQLAQQNASQLAAEKLFTDPSSSDLNESIIDFYHSIVRFVKYAYELPVYRNQIIRNRIIVFICKYLFKLDKYLIIRTSDILVSGSTVTTSSKVEQVDVLMTSKTTKTETSSEPPSTPTTPTDSTEKIFITKRYQSIVQDLIKQYLIVLDTWSQSNSFCPEFYNQIIEGNAIEHLHWLHVNKPSHLAETNPKRSTTPTSTTSSASRSTSSNKEKELFKYFDFSLNLLMKFCHNYDACRSEFGRIGGLTSCLSRLEEIGEKEAANDEDEIESESESELESEYDKMIEMICMSCKTASNRIRWRDSGNLAVLLKLQQKLRSNAAKTTKRNKHSSKNIDTTLYNRLLAALCCFIHDHDSMQILYAQGFVDSLLFYVNESICGVVDSENDAKSVQVNSSDKRFESLMICGENKKISLKKIVFDETFSDVSEQRLRKSTSMTVSKKRKATATETSGSKTRRLENSISTVDMQSMTMSTTLSSPSRLNNTNSLLRHSSTSPSLQMLNNNEIDVAAVDLIRRNSMSPAGSTANESCMSLSPTFSVSSPPPPPQLAMTPSYQYYRGGQQFVRSSFNYYSSNSLSPKSAIGGYATAAAAAGGYGAMSLSSPPNYLGEEFIGSASPSSSSLTNNPNVVTTSRIQFSPSIRDEFSSGEDNDDDGLDEEMGTDSSENSDDNNEDNDEQVNQQEICSFVLPIEPVVNKQSTVEKDEETSSVATSASGTAAVNIESINRTEACVFYVLSQLSHNEKSMLALGKSNFTEFLVSLLKYLKHAKVRNPRALRILNRLTKNPIYFRHFVLSLLPYRLKRIFNTRIVQSLFTTAATSASSSSSSTHLTTHQENEMNIYLNSNTAFFDASSSFPSFESIEFTLCNNLKSLCISSSDPGYSCLIGMMKQQRSGDDEEKLACALVAPFVLRNSKALCYLMVELNGLELILDALLINEANSSNDDESMRHKSLVCLRRILNFLAFKRDLKQLSESFESRRVKISTAFNNYNDTNDIGDHDNDDDDESSDVVDFILLDDNSSVLSAKKSRLAKQSGYFEALLEGPLSVNLKQNPTSKSTQIELSNVSRETLSIIVELLRCCQSNLIIDDCKLNLDQCMRLVIACDQYLLIDLKNFFIAAIVLKFISLGSLCTLLKLAWQIDNAYLACACVDFLLGLLTPGGGESLFDESDRDGLGDLERFLDYFFNEIRANNDQPIVDYFRRFLKIALTEIIKNNSWKF